MTSEKLKTKSLLDVGRLLDCVGKDSSTRQVGEILGVSHRRIAKWRNNPDMVLNPIEADRLANKLGSHPFEIWGWDWVDTE